MIYYENRAFEDFKPDSDYEGLNDTDRTKWQTDEFLRKKFQEYNERFFNNQLNSVPVKIGKVKAGAAGTCFFVLEGLDESIDDFLRERGYTRNSIPRYAMPTVQAFVERQKRALPYVVTHIMISNLKWSSRGALEDTLLHEMCHVYQGHVLCHDSYLEMTTDFELGRGSLGHGPKFFKAAALVNDSPDNIEGFKITQYSKAGDVRREDFKNASGWLVSGITSATLGNTSYKYAFFPEKDKAKALEFANQSGYGVFKYKDGATKAENFHGRSVVRSDVGDSISNLFEKALEENRISLVENTDKVNLTKSFGCTFNCFVIPTQKDMKELCKGSTYTRELSDFVWSIVCLDKTNVDRLLIHKVGFLSEAYLYPTEGNVYKNSGMYRGEVSLKDIVGVSEDTMKTLIETSKNSKDFWDKSSAESSKKTTRRTRKKSTTEASDMVSLDDILLDMVKDDLPTANVYLDGNGDLTTEIF